MASHLLFYLFFIYLSCFIQSVGVDSSTAVSKEPQKKGGTMISLEDDNFPELTEATTQQVLCGYNIMMNGHMCDALLKVCNNWDKKQIGMTP